MVKNVFKVSMGFGPAEREKMTWRAQAPLCPTMKAGRLEVLLQSVLQRKPQHHSLCRIASQWERLWRRSGESIRLAGFIQKRRYP